MSESAFCDLTCLSSDWISSRALQDGDIINVDITVYLNGMHGDTSQTFLVGDVVSCHRFHYMRDVDV